MKTVLIYRYSIPNVTEDFYIHFDIFKKKNTATSMLVTHVGGENVQNLQQHRFYFLTLASGTNIQKTHQYRNPVTNTFKIVTNVKSPTSTCHQFLWSQNKLGSRSSKFLKLSLAQFWKWLWFSFWDRLLDRHHQMNLHLIFI